MDGGGRKESGGGKVVERMKNKDKRGHLPRWEVDMTVAESSEERSGSCGERKVSGDSSREETRVQIAEAFMNREIMVKSRRRKKKGGQRASRPSMGLEEAVENVVIVDDEDETKEDSCVEVGVETLMETEGGECKGVKRKVRSEEWLSREDMRPESSSSGVLSFEESGREAMSRKERRLRKVIKEVKKLEEGVGVEKDPMEGVMKANRLAKRMLNGIEKVGREEEVETFRRILDVVGEYMTEVGLKMGRLEGEVGVWRAKAEEKVRRRDRVADEARSGIEEVVVEREVASDRSDRRVYLVEASRDNPDVGVEGSSLSFGSEMGEMMEREGMDVLDMSPGEDQDLESEQDIRREMGVNSRSAEQEKNDNERKKIKRMIRPKLIVYDMRKDMNEEQAIREIYEEWKDLWEVETFLRNFKVVARKKGGIIAGVERVNWLVEVSGEIQEKFIEKKSIRIGEESYRCKEYKDIARCFKCQRFGHVARICRMELTCGRCTGRHDSTGCKSTGRHECVNCRRRGSRGYHTTNSCSCPVMMEETRKYLESLDKEMK